MAYRNYWNSSQREVFIKKMNSLDAINNKIEQLRSEKDISVPQEENNTGIEELP